MSRDSERAGSLLSASCTSFAGTGPGALSGAACACAHAQLSVRFGNSSDGFAGEPIVSSGSGAFGDEPMVTPSCFWTTIRQSHGRSLPSDLAATGVNNHGSSGRSNSMHAKLLDSKSDDPGAGSVRMI